MIVTNIDMTSSSSEMGDNLTKGSNASQSQHKSSPVMHRIDEEPELQDEYDH